MQSPSEAVALGSAILFHQVGGHQRPHDAVRRAHPQTRLLGDLGDAEAVGRFGRRPQHPNRAFDRLRSRSG